LAFIVEPLDASITYSLWWCVVVLLRSMRRRPMRRRCMRRPLLRKLWIWMCRGLPLHNLYVTDRNDLF
jgi:hypothetical protein